MATLRISLFGSIHVAHAAWAPELKITRAVQALLAYLLLYRQRVHPREVLANLFWGDHCEGRARSCMSTALWRLRRALEPGGTTRGTYLVTTPMGEVGFNQQSDHWLDVAVFEEQVGLIVRKPIQAMEADDVRQLENGIHLYIGELLEGFYDDWALRERERLRSLYLKSLAHLMCYYGHNGTYENAIACSQQILNHDPLREEIHREVMRLYLQSGQRAQAIRHYKSCCQILDAELGVPPMEETQALYHQILQGRSNQQTQCALRLAQSTALRSAQSRANSREPPGLEQAFQKLHLAMQHFEKSGEQLQRAFRLLEKVIYRK